MALDLVLVKGSTVIKDSGWDVEHGFLDNSFDAATSSLETCAVDVCKFLNVQLLLVVNQVHGQEILFIDSEPENSPKGFAVLGEADAIVVNTSKFSSEKRIAIGVRTADCIPVLLKTKNHLAVVHIGWRGIANGIGLKMLEQIAKREDSPEFNVLIGPCAGADAYIVGEDVIRSLQPYAVTKKLKAGLCLDLCATLCAQLQKSFTGHVFIQKANVCTITSARYFSHRRNPEVSGRNLAYIVIAGNKKRLE
jgi:YfiH family protein